ncbi:MAG TPA: DUF1553 domain-containing protein, partial [Gemmataceae bacterium]|nr:DUF1553 domain-containing protein [Gemmataceae bacterium]
DSLKHIHRLIVLSATYRQSSRYNPSAARVDAGNRLLWRKSPERLEAETLRDAILSVAGQLDSRLDGPSFQDFQITQAKGTAAMFYTPVERDRAEFHRRSLYRATVRGGGSRLLDAFDCPDPSATSPRRAVTTTPLQALALLNNALVLRMADAFARRLEHEAGSDVDRQIERAYWLAYGRAPDPAEHRLASQAVRQHGLFVLTRALFNSNEFLYVD